MIAISWDISGCAADADVVANRGDGDGYGDDDADVVVCLG